MKQGANCASRFLSGGRGGERGRRGTRPTQRGGAFSLSHRRAIGRFFAKQEKTPYCQAKKGAEQILIFLQSKCHPKLFIAWQKRDVRGGVSERQESLLSCRRNESPKKAERG